jgi:multiple sugar transport system ATP-binding protein
MRTTIKRLHQEFKTTTVYVTHDQVEAMTLATRVAVLHEGSLQQVGAPQEVYGRPANMFVARFMGAPAMNLINATLIREGGRVAVRFSLADGAYATLTLPGLDPALRGYASSDVVLGLRPEAITDADSADQSSSLQFIDNRIDVIEPAGSDTFVVSRMGGVDVVARLRADADARTGTTMSLAINVTNAVLFDPITRRRILAQ